MAVLAADSHWVLRHSKHGKGRHCCHSNAWHKEHEAQRGKTICLRAQGQGQSWHLSPFHQFGQLLQIPGSSFLGAGRWASLWQGVEPLDSSHSHAAGLQMPTLHTSPAAGAVLSLCHLQGTTEFQPNHTLEPVHKAQRSQPLARARSHGCRLKPPGQGLV